MATLKDLAARMRAMAATIDQAASNLAADTALTIVADLAVKTPVDTSQALSNWIVSLDAPTNLELKAHVPGEFGSTQRASIAETISSAKSVLKNKKPGQTIYISNSLPYIRVLNEGSSTQEPAGFVERAVLIGRKQKAKFKLKG